MPAWLRKWFAPALLGTAACVGLTACATEMEHGIPADASLVSEGNQRIAYRAPYDGQVYVYNAATNRLVYSGRVHRDEMVEVRPNEDRITIDGNRVTDANVRSGDTYRVFFERTGSRDVDTDR